MGRATDQPEGRGEDRIARRAARRRSVRANLGKVQGQVPPRVCQLPLWVVLPHGQHNHQRRATRRGEGPGHEHQGDTVPDGRVAPRRLHHGLRDSSGCPRLRSVARARRRSRVTFAHESRGCRVQTQRTVLRQRHGLPRRAPVQGGAVVGDERAVRS